MLSSERYDERSVVTEPYALRSPNRDEYPA
jgi:hypothetical protein